MIEELKRTLYAGIGAGVVTYEKLAATLDDLVAKGKLSAAEARETAEALKADSKAEFEKAQSTAQQWMNALLDKAAVARKSEVAALQDRIEQLEKTVEQLKSFHE